MPIERFALNERIAVRNEVVTLGEGESNRATSGFLPGSVAVVLSLAWLCAPSLDASSAVFPPLFELSALDGKNGFSIPGSRFGDRLGHRTAAAGDLNGDGYDDLIVAQDAAVGGEEVAYVLFGRPDFPPVVEVMTLDGARGFKIEGAPDFASLAGVDDFNLDGYADVLIGSRYMENEGGVATGGAYLVYGRASFDPVFDLLSLRPENGGDGGGGLVLVGESSAVWTGSSVDSGDVNGDGRADLLISSEIIGGDYVVYGADSLPPLLDLGNLREGAGGDGSQGFFVFPSGGVSDIKYVGDFTGDGVGDFSTREYERNDLFVVVEHLNDRYIVFGTGEDRLAEVDVRSDEVAESELHYSIEFGGEGPTPILGTGRAGDVDGDALEDYLLKVFSAPDGIHETNEISLLRYGKPDVLFETVSDYPGTGTSLSGMGDVNQDGFADFVVGAPGLNEAYLVYGRTTFDSPFDLADLLPENGGDGSGGAVFRGVTSGDKFGDLVAAAGDMNGDGIDDLAFHAPSVRGDETVLGATYIVFGRPPSPVKATLTGRCPGELRLEGEGLTPGGDATLVSGLQPGFAVIPEGRCQGALLSLEDPTVRATLPIDEEGRATRESDLPKRLCGTFLQLIDMATCSVSVAVEVP